MPNNYDENGWDRYKLLVLERLDSLGKKVDNLIDKHESRIHSHDMRIAKLEMKVGGIYFVASFVGAVAGLSMELVRHLF
jgi:hypothetical protein